MPNLTLRGRRVYYEWRGERAEGRETVVFLHDGLGAVGSWRDVPEAVGRRLGMNAVVYDRYGYGRSDRRPRFPYGFMEAEVPALEELLDGLGLRRAHLVGHSDGGSIALLFSAAHPARVGRVVTEAAHVFVEPETRAGIQALLDLQATGRTPGWLAKLHGERGEHVLRTWGRSWLTERHRRWRIMAALPGVRAPLLAVQGDADEFGTQAQVDAILAGVAGSRAWIAPGCGHTPHNQAADAFADQVCAFLGEGR